MAYTINKTNGSVFATVADGTVDTSSSVTVVGRNYSGYGEFLGENFIKLLENNANTSAPGSPLTGQLWFNSNTSTVSGVSAKNIGVYNGTEWKGLGSLRVSGTEPSTSLVTGDLWFDTGNNQLHSYNGSSFTLIGPPTSVGSGTTGSTAVTITDDGATDHVVLKVEVEDVDIAYISDDAEFTPNSTITGFATIKPGYQLSTNITGAKFQGTATDSDSLGGVAAANYLRSNANDTTSGTLGVLNDTGLAVGADSDFTVSVSGSDVTVKNVTSDGDIIFSVNDGGTQTTALTIDGATHLLTVAADPTASLGVATKAYVDSQVSGSGSVALARDGSNSITGDILPDTTNIRDLGSTTKKFQEIHATTFYGVSTSAQYADVAERFHADMVMEPGTVVEMGGLYEITSVTEDLTNNVFGVVSTKPAHLMNAGAGTDETHPAIAMNGRVPVKVIGQVNKGDRLVSAGNGFARAATAEEATAFNVIGRSLENKDTDGEGTVEAIVKVV